MDSEIINILSILSLEIRQITKELECLRQQHTQIKNQNYKFFEKILISKNYLN